LEGDTCDTCLFKRVRSNWFAELSIMGIESIQGLEWDQFDRVWGQVCCMLHLDFTGYQAKLKFIRGAF
jgi:hypothetical protein